MQFPSWLISALPVVAIVISIGSLSLSVMIALRDRPKLKAYSHAHRNPETGEYHALYVKAVNVGRRPIVLNALMGNYRGGETSGYQLENGMLKLGEGGMYTETIGMLDRRMIYEGPNGEPLGDLINLYFAGSDDRKYPVKDSKKNIKILRESISSQ